jgi:ppGpp synthetase/RelA/SpoT-type nucleotidyltranferase
VSEKPATKAVAATAASVPEPNHELPVEFDFVEHRRRAIDGYLPVTGLFESFAETVHSILKARLDADGIRVNTTAHRVKSVESFGDKAQKPSDDDPNLPKYPSPLQDITDLAGVRAITNYLSTEAEVDDVINAEFAVVEKTNRTQLLLEEERFGYHGIHYLVRLRENRQKLPEYKQFNGLVAEIQVRTVLQHAWAEIEHDIQYKARTTLTKETRRRFMTLAGLLEIADREFQSIQDENLRLQVQARELVEAGNLDRVEITPDSLKQYVDRKLGPDGRMSDFSYQWTSRLLARLGFSDLGQLDQAISPYDDDQVSRAVHGLRQGQLSRLENMLLAALGNDYIARHPWRTPEAAWYTELLTNWLERLRKAGIPIGAAQFPKVSD